MIGSILAMLTTLIVLCLLITGLNSVKWGKKSPYMHHTRPFYSHELQAGQCPWGEAIAGHKLPVHVDSRRWSASKSAAVSPQDRVKSMCRLLFVQYTHKTQDWFNNVSS